jgi:twinkle protein
MGLSERATAWIEARGLDPELAAKLGLQSLPRGDGGEELAFPFFVGAEVVNNKYRNLTDKRFRQDAGAVKCFWNANAILDQGLDDQPLIITEGEIDAMTAIQAGYVRTVSVPDGAPAREIDTEEQSRKYSYLEHAKAALRDVREIILARPGASQRPGHPARQGEVQVGSLPEGLQGSKRDAGSLRRAGRA